MTEEQRVVYEEMATRSLERNRRLYPFYYSDEALQEAHSVCDARCVNKTLPCHTTMPAGLRSLDVPRIARMTGGLFDPARFQASSVHTSSAQLSRYCRKRARAEGEGDSPASKARRVAQGVASLNVFRTGALVATGGLCGVVESLICARALTARLAWEMRDPPRPVSCTVTNSVLSTQLPFGVDVGQLHEDRPSSVKLTRRVYCGARLMVWEDVKAQDNPGVPLQELNLEPWQRKAGLRARRLSMTIYESGSVIVTGHPDERVQMRVIAVYARMLRRYAIGFDLDERGKRKARVQELCEAKREAQARQTAVNVLEL